MNYDGSSKTLDSKDYKRKANHCNSRVLKKIFISNVSHTIIWSIQFVCECFKIFWCVVKLVKLYRILPLVTTIYPLTWRFVVEI